MHFCASQTFMVNLRKGEWNAIFWFSLSEFLKSECMCRKILDWRILLGKWGQNLFHRVSFTFNKFYQFRTIGRKSCNWWFGQLLRRGQVLDEEFLPSLQIPAGWDKESSHLFMGQKAFWKSEPFLRHDASNVLGWPFWKTWTVCMCWEHWTYYSFF